MSLRILEIHQERRQVYRCYIVWVNYPWVPLVPALLWLAAAGKSHIAALLSSQGLTRVSHERCQPSHLYPSALLE